jgi:hypothetical protein
MALVRRGEQFRGPNLAAIALRIVAATALSIAAFLLARNWKLLLSAAILAGLGFAGILLYGYWTDRVAERRTQKIHDCAVAKVATAKCIPPNTRGDVFDQVGKDRFQVCDRYALSENPTAQEEDAAITAAEKECTAEMEPKQKSAHEQIEEYKRQHGIKD